MKNRKSLKLIGLIYTQQSENMYCNFKVYISAVFMGISKLVHEIEHQH